MSIKLGLYDFFTNIIPGFLFLFVISELGKLLGLQTGILSDTSDISQLSVFVIAAFIIGHTLNLITFPWYRMFVRKHDGQIALDKVQKLYPDLPISFNHDDIGIIRTILRDNDEKQSEHIESLHVNAMFARNISFGMFLLAIVKLLIFIKDKSSYDLLLSIGAAVLFPMAILRARDFYRWFYREIFLGAIKYGFSVKQILKFIHAKEKKL